MILLLELDVQQLACDCQYNMLYSVYTYANKRFQILVLHHNLPIITNTVNCHNCLNDCLSLGANGTRKLLLWIVRWTWNSITRGLHVIEQSTIGAHSTTGNRFRVFINAHSRTSTCMVVVFSHEISAIFQGPRIGARDSSWNFYHCLTSCGMAQHTRCIVLMYGT